ncbi:hypothetical protein [Hallella colorans]|uniref:hypothetical protein n=1 Tax=Hallella colorans TaxID=1703337 RepID=UPI0023F34BDA|nr:hypothetical protein [Hallella colorans]
MMKIYDKRSQMLGVFANGMYQGHKYAKHLSFSQTAYTHNIISVATCFLEKSFINVLPFNTNGGSFRA